MSDGSYWLYQHDNLGQVTSAKKVSVNGIDNFSPWGG